MKKEELTSMNISLNFIDINSMKYCEEQDIETRALKLQLNSVNICALTIYTQHTGDFYYFILKLDVIMHTLYTPPLDSYY
jgi:hypothetical protein